MVNVYWILWVGKECQLVGNADADNDDDDDDLLDRMMIGRDVVEGPGVINPSGRRRPAKKVTNGKIGAGSEPKAG